MISMLTNSYGSSAVSIWVITQHIVFCEPPMLIHAHKPRFRPSWSARCPPATSEEARRRQRPVAHKTKTRPRNIRAVTNPLVEGGESHEPNPNAAPGWYAALPGAYVAGSHWSGDGLLVVLGH